MTARRELQRFVKRRHAGVVQAFADTHHFSRPLVSMWLSGKRTPGWVNAHRLQRITGIPAEAWLSAADRKLLTSHS